MPRCRFSPASPRLRLQTFAQGACAFADKVHKVRVVDGTGNLRLVDTARPPGGEERDVDTIIVDVGPGNFEQILAVPYGRPVLVDGRLFQVVVSEAEARVTASPYEGPTGLLRVGKPFWTARLRTADTAFDVCGGPDPLPLPPGAYEFVAFTEWPSADRSKPANILVVRRQWTDHAGFASTPAPPFQVVAGQTTDVAVGSPIRAGLTVRKEPGVVILHLEATDAGGRFMPMVEHSTNMYWGQRNPNTVDVRDAGDRVVARCEMKWDSHHCLARWPLPPDARGRYSAVLSFAAGPFEVQTSPVSFAVP